MAELEMDSKFRFTLEVKLYDHMNAKKNCTHYRGRLFAKPGLFTTKCQMI